MAALRIYNMSRKEGWRRFVDDPKREKPETLTAEQYRSLGEDARDDYNELRKDWHANLPFIKTPQVKKVWDSLELIVDGNRQDPARVRGAAVIDSLAQLGKTTVANTFARDFERRQRRRHGETTAEGHQRLSVLRVGLDAAMTQRALNARICQFYGHPGEKGASAARLGDFAIDCVLSCETQLGIIDDIHFLNLKRKNGIEVSNYLKWMANEMSMTFIFTGIGLAERRMFDEGLAGDEAILAQTSRRWTRLELPPFQIANNQGRQAWKSLLNQVEEKLVLINATPGMLTEMSDYLFARSTGYIGSLMYLITRGCLKAINTRHERLDPGLLDQCDADSGAERSQGDLQAAFAAGTLTTTPIRRPAARAKKAPAALLEA
ncbi:TniB family NTP-binding protein [Actinoplanes sp. NPDC026670]|uniref:TniB family NTP-binding protein n=1 Tax=Actinoplanes sp. NPDC026670 TaxID=3154700 RepID=UPI0033D7A4E4